MPCSMPTAETTPITPSLSAHGICPPLVPETPPTGSSIHLHNTNPTGAGLPFKTATCNKASTLYNFKFWLDYATRCFDEGFSECGGTSGPPHLDRECGMQGRRIWAQTGFRHRCDVQQNEVFELPRHRVGIQLFGGRFVRSMGGFWKDDDCVGDGDVMRVLDRHSAEDCF
ncbi:hypothetical protein BGZ60DRAFT_397332 [Tricladium varicosporioides]|nr:hypothetical protein BGZ60DRAFT_397332 [Hymenoscyphus varicosporioides]